MADSDDLILPARYLADDLDYTADIAPFLDEGDTVASGTAAMVRGDETVYGIGNDGTTVTFKLKNGTRTNLPHRIAVDVVTAAGLKKRFMYAIDILI